MQDIQNKAVALKAQLSTCLEKMNVGSFLEVAENEDYSLVSLKEECGVSAVLEMLIKMISRINGFYNVGSKMNPMQTLETAHMMLDTYYYVTLSDIALFEKWAKGGIFGECYRIDGAVLMRWMNEYSSMRAEYMQGIEIKDSDRHKEEDKEPIVKGISALSEETRKSLEETMKSWKHR